MITKTNVMLIFSSCYLLGQTQTTPLFTITDVGALTSSDSVTATALSDTGLVAGFSSSGFSLITGGTAKAFLFDGTKMKDLGSLGAANIPLGVNSSNTVTGISGTFGFVISLTPFLYQGGTLQSFTTVTGNNVVPFAINKNGQIAGSSGFKLQALQFPDISSARAFLFTGSNTTLLPNPSGTSSSFAFGLSPDGHVAGGSQNSISGAIVPVVWANGTPATFTRPSSFLSGFADSVANSGQAAGAIFNYSLPNVPPNALAHAAVFANGATTDIHSSLPITGPNSVATGINSSGWVVGFGGGPTVSLAFQLTTETPADTSSQAFLYANGQGYDLSKLLVNGAGWTLSYVAAINDVGQIAGTGLYNGQQHAFLLTPATPPPAPSITSIAGAGLSIPAVKTLTTGGLFSIFGANFANQGVSRGLTGSDIVNNTVPVNLASTCVQVGSARAPLTYVSPAQINAQTPAVGTQGTVNVSVIANCGTTNEQASPAVAVPVAAQSPEFLYFVQNLNGNNPVAAITPTGTYVGPTGLIPGVSFTPAHAGDTVTVFAVGLGATTPAQTSGVLAPGIATLSGQVELTLGGTLITPLYIGVTPQFVGLYQINFVVPPGLAPGNQPLSLKIAGTSSPDGAYLAIQ